MKKLLQKHAFTLGFLIIVGIPAVIAMRVVFIEGQKRQAAKVATIAIEVRASGDGIDFYSVPGESKGRYITEYKGGWFYFPYKGRELTAARTWVESFLKLEFVTTAEQMAVQSRYMEPLPAGFTDAKDQGSFIKFRRK